MSIYRRYFQENVKKGGFRLTSDNILAYREMSRRMCEEVVNLKSYLELQSRSEDPSLQDGLFTPEYISRRIAKLEKEIVLDEFSKRYLAAAKELPSVNAECTSVLSAILQKGGDGCAEELSKRTEELSKRMEELNDRRVELEDELVRSFTGKYGDLRRDLPNIFFIILDSVDMETLLRCFDNMVKILSGDMDVTEGAEDMMSYSQKKYSLPNNIYDPIRLPKKKRRKGV